MVRNRSFTRVLKPEQAEDTNETIIVMMRETPKPEPKEMYLNEHLEDYMQFNQRHQYTKTFSEFVHSELQEAMSATHIYIEADLFVHDQGLYEQIVDLGSWAQSATSLTVTSTYANGRKVISLATRSPITLPADLKYMKCSCPFLVRACMQAINSAPGLHILDLTGSHFDPPNKISYNILQLKQLRRLIIDWNQRALKFCEELFRSESSAELVIYAQNKPKCSEIADELAVLFDHVFDVNHLRAVSHLVADKHFVIILRATEEEFDQTKCYVGYHGKISAMKRAQSQRRIDAGTRGRSYTT